MSLSAVHQALLTSRDPWSLSVHHHHLLCDCAFHSVLSLMGEVKRLVEKIKIKKKLKKKKACESFLVGGIGYG